MVIRLRDVLSLPDLQELKIVAGAAGLDRVLHWTHVVDLPDVMKWVQGGELLFTTGIGIRDKLDELPEIVEACYKKGVAGLVINVGPYIEKTPAVVLKLAEELDFPVFEVAWEVKLVKVTRAIYDFIAVKHVEEKSIQDILENILYGNPDNWDGIMARAAACGYDLSKTQQVMTVQLDNLDSYLQETCALTEQQILLVKLQIQNTVLKIFERLGKKVLVMYRVNTVVIMLPTLKSYAEQQKTKEIAAEILKILPGKFLGLECSIGWGNPFAEIWEAKKSLAQAEQACRVTRVVPGPQKLMGYDGLGFYKVLFGVKDRGELEAFRDEVLDVLLEYDRKHGAELMNTLTVFLEENENFAKVSERLYIHRNTLKYRLQKIAEITGRNMADSNDRMLLYFATIVHKFLYL